MKRIINNTGWLLCLISMLYSCNAEEGELTLPFESKITVNILDQDGQELSDVEARIDFVHVLEGRHKSFKGRTGVDGIFEAEGKISASVWVSLEKNGFYKIEQKPAVVPSDVNETSPDVELKYVLREKLNPGALFARSIDRAIPQGQDLVGFDFAKGDWVKPFGNGDVADLHFHFERAYGGIEQIGVQRRELDELVLELKEIHLENINAKRSYFKGFLDFYETSKYPSYEDAIMHRAGKWDGKLILIFDREYEGVALVDEDYNPFSELTMPHHAYSEIDDYVRKFTWSENNYSPRNTRDDVGYFLRTRVRLDDDGNMVSANYAKITDDVEFDPRGRIRFSYVFNPIPNDRNLEFDPSRNLFKGLKDEEKITAP